MAMNCNCWHVNEMTGNRKLSGEIRSLITSSDLFYNYLLNKPSSNSVEISYMYLYLVEFEVSNSHTYTS